MSASREAATWLAPSCSEGSFAGTQICHSGGTIVNRTALLLLFAVLPLGFVMTPAPGGPADESVFVRGLPPGQHESLLYVWTSDADQKEDRKSTRLNSSHLVISYAVFCLKKKKKKNDKEKTVMLA